MFVIQGLTMLHNRSVFIIWIYHEIYNILHDLANLTSHEHKS